MTVHSGRNGTRLYPFFDLYARHCEAGWEADFAYSDPEGVRRT